MSSKVNEVNGENLQDRPQSKIVAKPMTGVVTVLQFRVSLANKEQARKGSPSMTLS